MGKNRRRTGTPTFPLTLLLAALSVAPGGIAAGDDWRNPFGHHNRSRTGERMRPPPGRFPGGGFAPGPGERHPGGGRFRPPGLRQQGRIIDIRLPSEGAGGGTLAVRICAPESPARFRFKDGAPVVVFVAGGQGPEGIDTRMSGMTRQGIIEISFNYPGGTEDGLTSDGEYDYRGMNCIRATRDVIRFALGDLTDSRGRRLHEIIGGPVCYKDVGVLGSSSGGVMFFSTFAQYPEPLRKLAFYVGWENPVTSQTILFDLGAHDARTGRPLPNPAFRRYGPQSCEMDFSHLKWDPRARADYRDARLLGRIRGRASRSRPPVHPGAAPGRQYSGALYLDNNGNNRCDVPAAHSPRLRVDQNGNGKVDPDEDWPFAYIAAYDRNDNLTVYYSVEVTKAAYARRVFGPDGPPPHIATLEECLEFWSIRNSLPAFPLLRKYDPRIMVILVAGKDDHVQSCPVYPGIQQAYDALTSAGIWRRLNPDAEYVRLVVGNRRRVRGRLPDNDANCRIRPGTMGRYTHPVDIGVPKPMFQLAAILELVDRVHAGNRTKNLSRILYPSAPYGASADAVRRFQQTSAASQPARPAERATSPGNARRPAAAAAPRYLITVVNCNYFPSADDQKRCIAAMRTFLRIARKYGVEPELYFTGLAFDMYRKRAPEIIRSLRGPDRDWHHHGANRLPHPTPLERVRGLSWDQAVKAIQEYERYELVFDQRADSARAPSFRRSVPRPGLLAHLDHQRTGGLKKMCAYFGRPPLSTGRFFKAPILEVCRQYGARMAVGLQDTWRLPTAWCWYMGMLMRPDDVFIHPTWDFNQWCMDSWRRRGKQPPRRREHHTVPGESDDLRTRIEQRLARLDPGLPAFVVYCFHDNDFFGYRWNSRERYSSAYEHFYMQQCESILEWLVREKHLRPVSLRQVYQAASRTNRRPGTSEARLLARTLVENVRTARALPMYVDTDRGGFALTEAWQLFAAVLSGRKPTFPPLLGPTESRPPSRNLPTAIPAGSIRQACGSIAVRDRIPAEVRIGHHQSVNAAEFLYLMAQVVTGKDPASPAPLSLAPRLSRERRGDFRPSLEALQFWTYKPAYYQPGTYRVQKTLSPEVNSLGREERRRSRGRAGNAGPPRPPLNRRIPAPW